MTHASPPPRDEGTIGVIGCGTVQRYLLAHSGGEIRSCDGDGRDVRRQHHGHIDGVIEAPDAQVVPHLEDEGVDTGDVGCQEACLREGGVLDQHLGRVVGRRVPLPCEDDAIPVERIGAVEVHHRAHVDLHIQSRHCDGELVGPYDGHLRIGHLERPLVVRVPDRKAYPVGTLDVGCETGDRVLVVRREVRIGQRRAIRHLRDVPFVRENSTRRVTVRCILNVGAEAPVQLDGLSDGDRGLVGAGAVPDDGRDGSALARERTPEGLNTAIGPVVPRGPHDIEDSVIVEVPEGTSEEPIPGETHASLGP